MMRVPLATYRLQFVPSFDFRKAREAVAYLASAGFTDIYASPIFKARKGSAHGYDVVDSNQLQPILGTEADLRQLKDELALHNMGWLQDIVPNHMAFDGQNSMLMDVLENGEHSAYHAFFDIQWNHPHESMRGRVLAPFLGTFFGESLEKGQIRLNYDADGLHVCYYDFQFPLKMESYASVFTYQLSRLKKAIGADHPDFIKLLGIMYTLKNLPSLDETAERYDQIRFAKRLLWELYTQSSQVRWFIDENVRTFNGKPGDALSFNLLDELLSGQLFRLSFWKVATEEINYRRFFNINELISLRMEDEDVFNKTHSLILNLIRTKTISGLRIDHIDGLYDPASYLRRLKHEAGDCYVVVEKILDMEEELPSSWPIQGTTGYEFLNWLNGIFIRKESEKKVTKTYGQFTGLTASCDEIIYEKKKLILEKHMTGDMDNLVQLLEGVTSRDRHGADITVYGLKMALMEIMAWFPVYRTYMDSEILPEKDRDRVRVAVEKARHRNPGLINELKFIERFLLMEFEQVLSESEKERRIHFIMRFQQLTGPLMAKGYEDTTLYVYNRLLSLNEVGGDVKRFGISPREFHHFNKRRGDLWPHSLNATATHDTKRGEDVRARLNVLSELPEEWETNLRLWSRINRGKKEKVRETKVPVENDEYFLYQTLVGAFPFDQDALPPFLERLKEYMIKAVREAKVYTAWLKPDTAYENAYLSFMEKILAPAEGNPFLKSFLPLQKKIAYYGILNSLSQTLVKISSPGLPDFYQGTELWDLHLVDPDNRRGVDFEKRHALLEQIQAKAEHNLLQLITDLISNSEDGRIKLFLIWRALSARGEFHPLFTGGSYMPLEGKGKYANHILAFARRQQNHWAVTIAPRLMTAVVPEGEWPLGEEIWEDTEVILPGNVPTKWENVFTDQIVTGDPSLRIGGVLRHFPVALLIGKETI